MDSVIFVRLNEGILAYPSKVDGAKAPEASFIVARNARWSNSAERLAGYKSVRSRQICGQRQLGLTGLTDVAVDTFPL
jgi:hypothetical protein